MFSSDRNNKYILTSKNIAISCAFLIV
ncbi:hypothetical protein Nmel_000794 [Mimus melanotis]